LRIVFFGTPSLSVEALKVLHGSSHEVALCVTQPDRPAGRKMRLQPPEVKLFCEERGIDCIQPDGFKSKSDRLKIESCEPDILMTAAYGRIIPERIFSIGRLPAINLHPSLLPLYRGAAPIRSALINGDQKTGVTIIRVAKELDAGDIMLQRDYPLSTEVTWGELSVELFRLGGRMLIETTELLERGECRPRAQEHNKATYVHKIGVEDRALDFTRPADQLANLIRAMLPQPPAFFTLKGKRVFVTAVAHAVEGASEPGRILAVGEDGLKVGCGEGALMLPVLKAEGKKDLAARDFANGQRLKAGDCFDNG